MTLASGRDRRMVRPTCTIWESGSCHLERALEVFGDGELRDLVSRFGGALVSGGLVERVFEHLFFFSPTPPPTSSHAFEE